MSTSAPAPAPAAGTAKNQLLPPEEKFWERYSPLNEAPLSGVSSTVMHLLAIGLILGIFWVNQFFKFDEENRSLPVEPIRLTGGGGGGNPRGSGTGPGDPGDIVRSEQESGELPPDDVNSKAKPPELQELNPSIAPKIESDFGKEVKPTKQLNSLAGLGDQSRDNLRKSIGGGGKGGSGSGGGRDTGMDKGEGGGKGDGKGLNAREKRVLRWALLFNTKSGIDYRDQLVGLGAIVAVPSKEEGHYSVIRDLKKPAPKVEDVTSMNRIFWIDDKPESVRALFQAMNQPVPSAFVAFFPKDVEDRMLRLELAYTEQKYRTRDENRIQETRFDVIKDGDKYDIKVNSVYLNR